MKSFIICFILCGLVFLVGCGSDSAKPPVAPPGGGSDVWQITSLVSSDSDPLVNTGVLITATVSLNGSAAPDGTEVKFTSTGGGFNDGDQTGVDVLTTAGKASAVFGATEPGLYEVSARVKSVTSKIDVVFRDTGASDSLQIYNVNPSSGSYFGDEVVVLAGKGITTPVEVYFTVQGVEYQAAVDQVVESFPLSNTGSITLRTPEPTAADKSVTFAADLKIFAAVGTDDQQTQILPSAFTFIGNTEPPPGVAPTPVIFGVDPYWGNSQGGDTVTILGLNFTWDNDGVEEQTFTNLTFLFRGESLLPQIERVSANQIEVITPRFSVQPLQEDEVAAVRVNPVNGENPVTKNNAFIVLSDVAIPAVTGLSPTAGPLDGGTVVSISGHGFELPLQVHFGVLEATNVQLFNDNSLADNDVITCTTPDYSQQGEIPPIEVAVKVTNLGTGLNSIAGQNFRYGDILYVGQANPTEGQIGDLLTLYGAGFEDPLTVWFSGNIEFDVISVTGTELTLRSPPELEPTCGDRQGIFRVVLNESNRDAEGGNYTLLGSNPTITSVDPIFVDEVDNGDGVIPNEIDIYGVRFAEDLLVLVDNYTIDPSRTTVETAEHIHVNGIPAPTEFGLVFATTACTTDTGLQGIKQVATPVDVTVRNLPVGCQNTLAQTLVYVPQDETCVVAPDLQVAPLTFPITEAGTCSAAQPLTITNNGAGTLDISTLFLQGQFFFDAGGANQNAGPLTIAPFAFDSSLDIYFCPDIATGGPYNGQLAISSNNPTSPNSYNLTATESTPPLMGTAPHGDGDTWTFPNTAATNCSTPQALTITNTGVSMLDIAAVNSSDVQFNIIDAPLGLLDPLSSADVTVEFCPTAIGAVTATLSIVHNASNQPVPIAIDLNGNGT